MLVTRDEFTEVYWVPLTIECYLNCCNCNNCRMSLALESGTCLVKYSVQQLLSRGIMPQLTGTEENTLYIEDTNMKGDEMRRRSQSKGLLLKYIYEGGPYSFSENYDLKVYKSKVGHPMFNVTVHIQDKNELAEKYGRSGLLSLYTKLGKTSELFSNPKSNLMILANLVWGALEEVAEDLPTRAYKKQSILNDIQIEEVKSKKSPGRPKVDQKSRVVRLINPEVPFNGLPPQAQICAIILKDTHQTEFTIQELKEIFNQAHASGKLKTRQNPYRIFDYYKNRLKQRGVIQYD